MSRFDSGKVRAMFGGRGFYIALVLCLVVVGVLGWYAVFGTEISRSFELSKAESEISLSFWGSTNVSIPHSLNAATPIDITVLGIEILRRLRHP